MKTLLLVLGISLAFNFSSFAQWSNGMDIYNSIAGNIGIGTTNPNTTMVMKRDGGGISNQLTLENSYSAGGDEGSGIFFKGFYNQARITSYSDPTLFTGGILQFQTYGNNSTLNQGIVLVPNGNVGIGTTNPSALTNIYKSWGGGPSGGTTVLRVEGQGVGDVAYPLATFVHGGNAPALHVMASGNVGVGTTTPNENLSVAGSSSSGSISLVPGTTTYAGYKLILNTQAADEGFNMTMGGTKIMSAYGYNDADEVGFGNLGHQNLLYLNSNGNVGIGTKSADTKLTVNGTIHSKEVKVDNSIPVPDYVFEPDYKLTSLEEIKVYVDKNHHLPEIPSAKEIEKNGICLGAMNMKLLKKVEELTLYLIEQKEALTEQQKVNQSLQSQINQLKNK